MSFELTQSLNMPVFHGNVVRGLILAALYGQYASPLDDEHHLPLGLVLVPCESGRTLFAAGDRYQIGITCLSKEAESAVRHLAERVASIGRTIDLIDGHLPVLGGNYVDVVWEELPPVDIFEQINKIQHNGVTLQFVSPLKMRTPDEYAKKIPLMGSACFPVTHFFKQVWSGVNKLIHVAPYAQMPPVHSVEIVDKCFVQIETPLWGGQGGAASHKRKKIIGVQGHVTFANVPKDWVPLLVLGQYSHVGGNRAYGFGRYVLHGLEDDAYALRPSRSVLDAVQADGLLKAAFTHVAASSESSGVDNVTPDDYQQRFAYYTGRLCAALHQNTYTAQPLRGFLLEKANGKQRPMAIPTVEDRMLQRAVATQMTPLLEQLFEHNSYGYRPGRSRAQAAETIDRARREGYTHVVDADIRSFFDCVPWKPLLAKVQALYPFDPVVALVEQWITSPVQYNGAILKRSQGLPQGASISPLLANLYLDEFDDALIAANYAIVRYADDFLILCKSKQEAEQARQAAEAALQQLNLQLSPEKTVIATYDRGFSYLGYLFCRSLVVEKKKSGTPMNVLSDESAAPASSQSDVPFGRGASFEQDAWLAQATIRPLAKRNDMPPQGKADSQTVHSFREMAALFAQNDLPEFVPPEPVRARVVTPAPSIPESLHASVSNAESAVSVGCNESGEDMPGKRPLYLLSPRTGLYLSNAALVVVPDDIKAGATAFLKKLLMLWISLKPQRQFCQTQKRTESGRFRFAPYRMLWLLADQE
ncbi:reverse transcriptase domain-containing protein [Oleidesulfovibrio alaskensis]